MERNIGKKTHKFKYTYEDIAELTGLTVGTLRVYASNKKFNPHLLSSVVNFVTKHKVK